uniref:Uncharacterized protein n=1 Tax=Avena sativa TaxID=4498 RepID=A0ACD5ZFW4_AVESA
MPASSRLRASATCSLLPPPPQPQLPFAQSPPRRRRRRSRLAAPMSQSRNAPPGSSRSSSTRWSAPVPRLDLGMLFGRKQRPGGERLDLGNWVRRVLSRPLPPPPAADREVEVEAEEEGREAGNREEVEIGGEEADHLVVMVNGLYGSSSDWKFGAEQFVKRLPGKVYVHRSECNHSTLTYDGVDLMGERLAEEVRQVVQRRGNLRKISFVAHSLGGLISRYAIGKLYEHSIDEENMYGGGKLAGLEPMNFIASATPHLGSRGNKQLPFLFGVPLLERTAVETAHLIVGRTGKHLFLSDRDDEKPPLLVRMVEDCDDGKFMSALRSFKRRVVYANITYDHIVGWKTSSIRRQHELPELELTANNEKYPHVIHASTANPEDPQEEDSVDASLKDSLEEIMICGLRQVTWERVDVCFHESRLKYNAHYNIQVRTPMNLEGEDVIYHMIDNFLV